MGVILVNCKYADGDSMITGFNGTLAEAKSYYEGKAFNIGLVDDNMQICTEVELASELKG